MWYMAVVEVGVCFKKGVGTYLSHVAFGCSDRSEMLTMMKEQTHSSALITNGLTRNDGRGVRTQLTSVIVDYFNFVL